MAEQPEQNEPGREPETIQENLDPGQERGTDIESFTRSFDVDRAREDTRRLLAMGLLVLVGVIALAAEAAVIFHAIAITDLSDLSVIFTPIVTLAGAAFGFFFGQQSSHRK